MNYCNLTCEFSTVTS